MPVDRDQQFLLPVDMRSWLGEDHRVWFLIDAVDQLDLSRFEGRYRRGGQGRRAFNPAMLLVLLLYAYSDGIVSSRRIEARCRTDAAYRVICGTFGQLPDHVTICRFRQRHQDDIKGLFVQVLDLAGRLGLVRLGVLAVDGTKLSANAALSANRRRQVLQAELDRLFAEAEAADAAEQDDRGDGEGGDRLPGGLGSRADRRARLAEALAQLDADQQTMRAQNRREDPKANPTDPDSRIMFGVHGFVQGYNAQFVVDDGGLIMAARVVQDRNDTAQLGPCLTATAANLDAAGIAATRSIVVADCGYWPASGLLNLETQGQGRWFLLVATGKHRDLPADQNAAAAPEVICDDDRVAADVDAQAARREELFARIAAGDISLSDAARESGIERSTLSKAYKQWRTSGRVVVFRPARKQTRDERVVMNARLTRPANKTYYRRRAPLAEGAIALFAWHRNGRRLPRRGLAAAQAEVEFRAVLHNLLKINQARLATTALFAV